MFKLINIILLVSVCSLIKGQEINTKDILSVTEEIKVSTDRKLYFNGEDIFFSANYFLNGQKTIPTLSNILYIELIECANKKSIIQQKYRINDFNVKSKIRIPNDINSGRYILRAFTQYQRNFSNYNYGYCLLTILNPNSKLVINSHKHVDSVFIAPESGILIDNIKNKVVINIPEKFIQKTDSYFINDEQDHLLKELNVNKAGFLQTEMQFDKSKSYYFSLLLKNGDTLTYSFPEVKQKGLQTNLSHNKHTIKFKAQSIDNNPENQLNLKIVSKNFHKNYSQKIIFSNNIFESVISKNDLSEGINYFLVTNKQNDIKSINTYYYQPKTVKDIAIKTDKETYTRRENVKVSLTIPALEHNIFPNITISVTRDKETSINNSVRSFATHPIILESYLEHSYSIIDQNIIDQLLILFDNQINYEHITRQIKQASNNHLNHIPELRNITISGILRDKNTKVPIEDHNVYLSVPFKNPQIHVYKTRENGEFLFSLNNIYKKADIFLCSETLLKENKEHEILIKSSFPSNIPDLSSIPIILDEKDINFINEVYINAQTQQKFKPTIDTSKTEKTSQHLSFNLNDNKTTIIMDNYVDFDNMQQLLYEIVPNIIVKKEKDNFYFRVLNEKNFMLPNQPLLILDHIPIFDPNKVMSLNPAQIEKVEVIYKPYVLGSHTFDGGVVMFFTNTDNFAEIEFPKSSIFLEFKGLNKPLSSYNPTKSTINKNIPDFRNTLYWNPKMELKSKETEFNFNTSDSRGKYNIEIIGYDYKGQKYYSKKQITIQE